MPPGRTTRASHQRVVEDVTNIDRTIQMKERSDDVKQESGKKDSDNVKQQGRVGLRARRRSTVTDVKTERNGTESQVDKTQQRRVVEVIVPTIARSVNTRQRANSGSGDSMASIATRRNKHEQPTVRVSARMRAKREQRALEDVTMSGAEESRQEINKELSPLSGISTPALSPSASTSVAVPSSPLRSCEYEEIPLVAKQEGKEIVSEMIVDEKPSKDSASTRHAANESPFQRNAAASMNHSDQSKAPVILPERSSMRTSRRLQSPAPMTSASEQPGIHGLRSSKAAARKASTIPFPSLSPTGLELDDEERENGALVEADLRDEKLMAVCAALEVFGNKALTAAEIGEACVQHGWIRPSPALPPANLVQSAIRAYHRRCASHIPERNCLVRKHILAGYAMEARLIPALHPSAAHDGFRRKGMVYYLEGQYGSSSWTNPFDRLEDDDAEQDISARSKQGQEPHAKKNPPNKRGRRPKTVNPPVQEDTDMNDDEDKPKGLKIKIKLGGAVNTSIQTSTDVMPEEAEQTEEELDLRKRKNTYSRVESDVETEDDAGESTSESEAQQYGGAGIPILQDSDSESDDDDEQVLPQSNSIRDFARSFFMDSPPVSRIASEAPSESRMLLEQGGLFPSNALDDSFDEPEYLPALSPADPDHSSEDDDDLVTELMDCEAPEVYIKTRRHVGFDLLSYREPGSPEEREADQEYSEVDTPATTPRTFCDDQDMEDRKDEDAQEADKDATLHLDLQNAVQVLGRLLPDLSDRPDEIQPVDRDQPIASTAIDMVQESFGNVDSLETEDLTSPVLEVPVRSRRKSSVGARDFLRLSLPIPVCPAPSPLNSPFLPNQPGPVVEAMDQLLDEPSSSSTTSGDQRDPTDLELLPGLGRQPAINDGESACICNPDLHDDHVMILGHDTSACQSDQLAHLQNGFQPVTEKEADAVWAELLGPESVGVDELDNVWGFVNAAVVVAARTKSKRHRREADGHSVASTASRGSERSCRHPQDSWGTIGVGSSADGTDRTRKMEKARFARALMTRAKALNLPSPRRTQLSPRKTLQNDAPAFDDDEAIGMEDVADAVLSAWADGDTILEEECDDGDLDSETHESNQAIFTAGLQSRFSLQDDMPMGISPSDLTKRPLNQVDHQVSTTLSVPASSDTTEIVEEDEDKGKDKNPAQDSRSGSIRQEQPVTTAKTNKTLSSPSMETSLPAKFPTKLPAPPRPAAHAAASPASVTSHGKIYVATTQPIWPPVHAIVIDRISLFSVLWRGKPIYRRIDSDYVNFSAILHALEAPDIKETETRLSGTIYSVILRGTDFPGINGVWLPLEIAEAEADRLDIPKDLKVVLFNGDLASLFPTPLPHLKAVLQKQGRAMASRLTMVSGRLFGIPFGCMEDTQKESTPANVPPSKPKPPTLDMIAGKRAITPSMNKNEGPPAKRRKSSSASAVSAVAARRLTRAQLGS